MFGQELREAATRLVDLIKAMAGGSFVSNREKDELTMALGNPKHPERCRGKGVIPWKFAFHENIHSYISRQRSKAKHARQLRELQQHIALTEARMEEAIDQCVALALSKQASEQAAASSGANVDVSPLSIKAASLPRKPQLEDLLTCLRTTNTPPRGRHHWESPL